MAGEEAPAPSKAGKTEAGGSAAPHAFAGQGAAFSSDGQPVAGYSETQPNVTVRPPGKPRPSTGPAPPLTELSGLQVPFVKNKHLICIWGTN